MTTTPALPTLHTSHPALKRSRRQDGETESPMETANTNAFNSNAVVQASTSGPAFLSLSKPEITSKFQELEWKQRFRLQHGLQNPTTSPYTLDKSNDVLLRNRYGNIQPWANSRIKLQVPTGTCDYINASPIILKDTTNSTTQAKYIATQGPKSDQFSHFWNMVMSETADPAVIIMLTQTQEANREKCAQYYPLSKENDTITFPALSKESPISVASPDPFTERSKPPTPEPNTESETTAPPAAKQPSQPPSTSGAVTLAELTYLPRYQLRKLSLSTSGKTKQVYHYLFPSWADFSKPEAEDREALLEIMRDSARRAGDIVQNARIVHCSAGVGRTGTWIAVDHLLRQLEAGTLAESSSKQGMNGQHSQENGKEKAGEETNGALDEDLEPATETRKELEAENCNGNKTNTEEVEGDLVFETVNALREQRMLMVMNELQYHFIYEVLREIWNKISVLSSASLQSPSIEIRSPDVKAESLTFSGTKVGDNAKDLRINTNVGGVDEVTTSSLPQTTDGEATPSERSPKVARKSEPGGGIGVDIYHGTKAEKPPMGDEDTVSMSGVEEDPKEETRDNEAVPAAEDLKDAKEDEKGQVSEK
ncbi:MAG: hypothetical protein Q9227_004042 [Pyrenula ochraceoflavens]